MMNLPFKLYLVVLVGSAIGGLARFILSGLIGSQFGETFPWGTIVVNITGSFVIGVVAGLSEPGGRVAMSPAMRLFLMTGMCGGYTTFSAFSLQTFTLLNEGQWGKATCNVVGSVALCGLATWLGFLAASAINPAQAAGRARPDRQPQLGVTEGALGHQIGTDAEHIRAGLLQRNPIRNAGPVGIAVGIGDDLARGGAVDRPGQDLTGARLEVVVATRTLMGQVDRGADAVGPAPHVDLYVAVARIGHRRTGKQ